MNGRFSQPLLHTHVITVGAYRLQSENDRGQPLAFGKTRELTEIMLQHNEQGAPRLIAIEFPEGPHAGERYDADITFCQNPTCRCGHVKLRLLPNPPGGIEESAPEFCFELDLIEQALATAEDEGEEYDRNMGQAFVEQMGEEDWQLLWELYYTSKRIMTEKTPDDELETYFPAAEIEASSTMVGFNEILPFSGDLQVEVDGNRYLFGDQYCVRTDCNCTEAYLTLLEMVTEDRIEKPDMAVISVDYRTGQWQIENLAGVDTGLLGLLAKQLITRENRTRIEERHNRLRALYRLYKRAHHTPTRSTTTRKVGRNDPCPCGSRKKYKKCCMILAQV